jgi:hypothetical protein
MSRKNRRVFVLGAGVTGLTAAWALSKDTQNIKFSSLALSFQGGYFAPTMPKRIVFTQSGKGGKTTLALSLYDYYSTKKVAVRLVDSDAENHAKKRPELLTPGCGEEVVTRLGQAAEPGRRSSEWLPLNTPIHSWKMPQAQRALSCFCICQRHPLQQRW